MRAFQSLERLFQRVVMDDHDLAVPANQSGGLDDTEYIEHLLREAGGRLKQQELLARTDWAKATLSRKLAVMETDGHIVRYKVDREKIVCLPDAAPDTEP